MRDSPVARARGIPESRNHACTGMHAGSAGSRGIPGSCMHAHACIVHASVGTRIEVCPDGVAVAMAVTMHPDVYNTHG